MKKVKTNKQTIIWQNKDIYLEFECHIENNTVCLDNIKQFVDKNDNIKRPIR
jgi:hypothetical protein